MLAIGTPQTKNKGRAFVPKAQPTLRPAARRHTSARAFTLVEVCIALAIMALASVMVLPALSNLSRAELRRQARHVAGVVRRSFDEAALTGQTQRMAFAIGTRNKVPAINIEATEDQMTFEGEHGAITQAARDTAMPGDVLDESTESPFGADDDAVKLGAMAENHDSPPGADGKTQALSALFGINRVGQRAAKAGFKSQSVIDWPESTRILDVWTEGMRVAAVQGVAYLYFFPNGFTQNAMIHVENDARHIFTISVESLTGKAEVLEGFVEVPK